MAAIYAVPTTLEEFETLIEGIHWDSANCNVDTEDLLARLQAIVAGWTALQTITLYVAQDAYPSQNDWETAWIDTGRALPITGTNVKGIWENLATDPSEKDVTEYVSVDGKFYPKLAYWWHGSREIVITNGAQYTNGTLAAASTAESNLATISVSLKKPGWIDAMFGGFVITGASYPNDNGTPMQWRIAQDALNYTRQAIFIDTFYFDPANVTYYSPFQWWSYLSPAALSSGIQNLSHYYRKPVTTIGSFYITLKSAAHPALKAEAGAWPMYYAESSPYMVEIIYL